MLTLSRSVSYRNIGAADVALWDLAGKIADLPIHALIGTYRNSIPAYASSQVLPSVEAYVEQAHSSRRTAGAPTRSIRRPSRRPTSRCARRCATRSATTITLMLDSTWSYRYPDALRVGRAIEELGFLWYEDPLADEDIYNYVKLRQKLDIPIMATEYPPAASTPIRSGSPSARPTSCAATFRSRAASPPC